MWTTVLWHLVMRMDLKQSKLHIRDLREDASLTQQFIADYLGIDQSYYSKCEREVYQMRLSDIIKLAQFYKTSVDYLTDLRDPYPNSYSKILTKKAVLFPALMLYYSVRFLLGAGSVRRRVELSRSVPACCAVSGAFNLFTFF